MKDKNEILTRAIILLCLSDRCALEKSIISGKCYSVETRETQKKLIYEWLCTNRYNEEMNQQEIDFFNQKIGTLDRIDLLFFQLQHEAVEPLLWAIGLVTRLADHKNFVMDDFHPVLQIGGGHNQKGLLSKSSLRSPVDIETQTEIAMLWYWRVTEIANPTFSMKPINEIIMSTFGPYINKAIESISNAKEMKEDFLINGVAVRKLDNIELNRLKQITRWRYHAFEWINSDFEWESVELNT